MAVAATTTNDAMTRTSAGDGGGQSNDAGYDDASAGDTAEASAGRWKFKAVNWLVVSCAALVVVSIGAAGLSGWKAHQIQRAQHVREEFIETGRQAAINLTSIGYTEVDADVARVVDMSTGQFRDDFQQRAPDFISVVKQAKSVSTGTIAETGLESEHGDQGQVLVAVSVRTTTPSDSSPQPRGWRMRISVERTGDGVKVSNVEFVE
jgi:Mce-associated membrane protein